MIVPNSEIIADGYVIGLCQGEDLEGKFFEAYYRKIGEGRENEAYTENNFWISPEQAYEGARAEIAAL